MFLSLPLLIRISGLFFFFLRHFPSELVPHHGASVAYSFCKNIMTRNIIMMCLFFHFRDKMAADQQNKNLLTQCRAIEFVSHETVSAWRQVNIREWWWWRHHLFYFTHFTINGRDRQLSQNNSRFFFLLLKFFFSFKLRALLLKSGSNEIITGVIWSNKKKKKMIFFFFFQNQILRRIIRLETKIENWSYLKVERNRCARDSFPRGSWNFFFVSSRCPAGYTRLSSAIMSTRE